MPYKTIVKSEVFDFGQNILERTYDAQFH
jgi:hypothetical protein